MIAASLTTEEDLRGVCASWKSGILHLSLADSNHIQTCTQFHTCSHFRWHILLHSYSVS